MFKNVASQKITLLAVDTSANLPKTGDSANITAYVSKDDGAVTVLGDTSATELDATNAPGLYSFDLTQAETNADKLIFSAKSSTSGIRIVPVTVYTDPASFTSFTTPPTAAAIRAEIDSNSTQLAAIVTDTNELQGDWTNGGRLDLLLDGVKAKTDQLTFTISNVLDANVTYVGGVAYTAITGTADSGTTTTMVDSARTEADADYWAGSYILFTSGSISGQCRLITGFTPGTDTITFAPATTQAVGTNTYEIIPAARVIGVQIIDEDTTTLDLDATIRSAIGMASANLDTQLDALPTNAELATALGTADDAVLAAIAALNNISTAQVNTEVDTALADVGLTTTITGRIDAAVSTRATPAQILTTQLTEAYRATGAAPTLAQAVFEFLAHMGNSDIVSTTKSLRKLDKTTLAKSFTLDDDTAPTAIEETT